MSEKPDTYPMGFQCMNCKFNGPVDIRKGCPTTQMACPNCGCTWEQVNAGR